MLAELVDAAAAAAAATATATPAAVCVVEPCEGYRCSAHVVVSVLSPAVSVQRCVVLGAALCQHAHACRWYWAEWLALQLHANLPLLNRSCCGTADGYTGFEMTSNFDVSRVRVCLRDYVGAIARYYLLPACTATAVPLCWAVLTCVLGFYLHGQKVYTCMALRVFQGRVGTSCDFYSTLMSRLVWGL